MFTDYFQIYAEAGMTFKFNFHYNTREVGPPFESCQTTVVEAVVDNMPRSNLPRVCRQFKGEYEAESRQNMALRVQMEDSDPSLLRHVGLS